MLCNLDRETAIDKLNTIYIISKGRPQCRTAVTLKDINYPGKWFIVVGNNDETIYDYIANFGFGHVIQFDWFSEIERTETMDNFGFDNMPSGAAPVRNATQRLSRDSGELRHWQFDDDYTAFYVYDPKVNKNRRIRDGKELQQKMLEIAMFGYNTSRPNVGFSLSTIEAHPGSRHTYAKRVFNAHNLASTDDLFQVWRARMNDDLINAMDVTRKGNVEMSFKYLQLNMEESQHEKGGLTEFYQAVGTVRKTAYAVLAMPGCVKLIKKFGRYHHRVNWPFLLPMVIREEWKKGT